jgi:hypothetical protein
MVSACWLISGIMLLRLRETLKSERGNFSLRNLVKEYPKMLKECVNVWKFVPKTMFYLFIVFSPVTFFVRMCIIPEM